MSRLERLAEYVDEQRWGILTDLAFAIAWVGLVTAFFDLTNGPQWAYYLCMFAGVVAYYLLFGMSEAAVADQ